MKNNEEIILASGIDNDYTQHLGVLLVSIFENKGLEKIKYYVFHSNLSEKNKKRLLKISKKYKFELIFKKINEIMFRDLKINNHFSVANYFCLTIPNFLYKDHEKVLFLDVDLIVLGSLSCLWKTNVKDCYLAATCDFDNFNHNQYLKLKLINKDKYFNTGVMLINNGKWIKKNVLNNTLKFIKKNPEVIEYADQDGLNYVIRGNYRKISIKNNYSVAHHPNFRFFNKVKPPQDILIYHFASLPDKPWNFSSINFFKKRYWYYLRKTPWRFRVYSDFKKITFKKIVKKYKTLFLIFINQQVEFFEFIKKIRGIWK